MLPLSIRRKLLLHDKYDKLLSLLKLKLGLPLRKPLKKINFEIHLVEHCNLNCKSCCHFSPLAEVEFISVEEFEREVKRMGELFSHECDEVRLLGGEPLLHPNINEFMKISRDIFPNGRISITTNGILLTQMKDDFWEACHAYNVDISISHYPIKLDDEKIKFLSEKFSVKCFWRTDDLNQFTVFPIDLEGKGDMRHNFVLCNFSNSCITLSHGRLCTCCFIAHLHLFNKKFKTNIPITEADYIDIYSDITKDEIFKKLAEPIPACRFCKVNERRPTDWEISKQDINEWL